MAVLGTAAALGCAASFKHSTLMCFPYGLYALLCGAAWALFSIGSAAAVPLAVLNLALLAAFVAALLWVQRPARTCRTPERLDWIVVLGCKLINGRPGRTLTRRLNAALACYRQHPEARLMVCGGKGEDEARSEAEAMAKFLVEQGLCPEEITLEDTSRTTAENLRNFLALTGAADAAVAVVTSDFHMGRALNLARQEGLTNASGLPAKTPRISWIGCAFREALILGAQKLGFRPSNITIGSKRL